MSGWTPGRRRPRRVARRRQCELYVRAWDGDCGKPFAGTVFAGPEGGDPMPFWHCSDHREALAMDLLGMGFVVQELGEIVTPPREPAAD